MAAAKDASKSSRPVCCGVPMEDVDKLRGHGRRRYTRPARNGLPRKVTTILYFRCRVCCRGKMLTLTRDD